MSAEPRVCVGCGKDHEPGAGCGYRRQVRWTPFPTRERIARLRFFPVIVGLLAAGCVVWVLADPPDSELFFYAFLFVSSMMMLVVGGLGTRTLIRELLKKRWRAASVDGRDRALVVLLGEEVAYAFGESLQYTELDGLQDAASIDSRSARLLGPELRTLCSDTWIDWLRERTGDRDALSDDDKTETLALVITAALFGLAARGDVKLFSGRYQAWERGGAKMDKRTPGTEIAVEASRDPASDADELDAAILSVAVAPSPDCPVPVDELVAALRSNGAVEPKRPEEMDQKALQAARDGFSHITSELMEPSVHTAELVLEALR